MRMVMELRADPVYSEVRHLCILKGNYLGAEDKKNSIVLTFDNDLTFQATGERQPLESLVKGPHLGDNGASEKATGYTREKYEKAAAMRGDKQSLTEIALALGYADKSAVSKLLKKLVL